MLVRLHYTLKTKQNLKKKKTQFEEQRLNNVLQLCRRSKLLDFPIIFFFFLYVHHIPLIYFIFTEYLNLT